MNLSKKPILLFETIKAINGEIVNFKFHLQRMKNSVKNELKFNPHEILNPPKNGLFRIKLIYDEDGNFIEINYFSYKMREFSSFKLIDTNLNYDRKYLDRSRIDKLFESRNLGVEKYGEKSKNADDIIMVRNGLITDTSIANLAIFTGDFWLTPKTPLLKGTTRARLLESDFLKEGDFDKHALLKAKKFAIMNAMIDFLEIENFKFVE